MNLWARTDLCPCWLSPLLGPFLRSDTETDFPRPVRSAKRSRFCVRSKQTCKLSENFSTNVYVLTDTTKTDFLHILVRTHLIVLTRQHSCMLLVFIGLNRFFHLGKNRIRFFAIFCDFSRFIAIFCDFWLGNQTYLDTHFQFSIKTLLSN